MKKTTLICLLIIFTALAAFIIAACEKNHDFGSWKMNTDSTCTEEGEEIRTCRSCGETETRAIPPYGHDEIWIIDREATCTKNGEKHKECKVCGEILATEVIKGDHNYMIEERREPMGSTDGYIRYTCDRCGDSYDDILAASPAPVSVWNGTDEVKPTSLVRIDDIYYYEINSAAELAYLHNETEINNYSLNCDIVLNDKKLYYNEEGELVPNASSLNHWTGFICNRFRGNGYKISGLYSTKSGLIYEAKGDITDLTVENAYINIQLKKGDRDYVGGICNSLGGSYYALGSVNCKKAEYCSFSGAIICSCDDTVFIDGDRSMEFSSDINLGGLFGYVGSMETIISHCECYGLIKAINLNYNNHGCDIGGIVYDCQNINNCVNYATIKSETEGFFGCGGILANSMGEVNNCTNYGEIIGQVVGGICGMNNGHSKCLNSVNYGNITATSVCGGIAGRNYGKIADSDNYGDVTGTTNVGGVCGENRSSITSSNNHAQVKGETNVGGVIGKHEFMKDGAEVSACGFVVTDDINDGLYGIGNMSSNEECTILHE